MRHTTNVRARRASARICASALLAVLAAHPEAGFAQAPPPAGLAQPGDPAGSLVGPPAPPPQLPPPDMAPAVSPQVEQLLKGAAGRPLSINEVVSVALLSNRSLVRATENLYRVQGRTAEVRSQLSPTASASVGDIYQTNSLQPAANVVGTLPIDISGLLHAATSQAEFQEIATKLEINWVRNQVVGEVKQAFYSVLHGKALVAVATENLQNSLDRLKDANLKYRARAVAYFDVVRAQTDVANARKEVIQARNAVSLATANLSSAMGVDVSTALQVSEAGSVVEPPGVPPPAAAPAPLARPGAGGKPAEVPRAPALELSAADLTAPAPTQIIADALKLGPEFSPMLKEALAARPEILTEDASIAAAQKGLKLARRSLLPALSVSAGWFTFRNSTGTTRVTEPQARLQLVFPLFDGGLARARKQQAQGEIALAITDKRQVIDRITLEVEQAYLNQQQARDEVAVANQALSEAQQAFDLARTRYAAGVSGKAGISPLLEVSDAQAALTRAETNRVDALYDYNLSRVLLDRALGRYAYASTGPGFTSVPPPSVVGISDPAQPRGKGTEPGKPADARTPGN